MKNQNIKKITFEAKNYTLKIPFITCIKEKSSSKNEKTFESNNGVYKINIKDLEKESLSIRDELYIAYMSKKEEYNYDVKLNESVLKDNKKYYIVSILKNNDKKEVIYHQYNIVIEIDNSNSVLIQLDNAVGILESGFLDVVLDGIEIINK